jgi:hypothetical protein
VGLEVLGQVGDALGEDRNLDFGAAGVVGAAAVFGNERSLAQGRSLVLVPRQVEALKARLREGSRTVSAMEGNRLVALCEMRAGRLNPVRVFQLT